MKIQFQADADFNVEVVLGLLRREPGIDFQTAAEANLRGVPDPEVLALAAQEQRILVTHDRRTMPRHFATLSFTTKARECSSSRRTSAFVQPSRNCC